MFGSKLEVADIFRRHGEAWRLANAGHINRVQRRVMKAIEICRTAKLGGHVERCQDCEHTRVAYNSCRNRHCGKCQGQSAAAWFAAREAELLPVPYFHLVFRLPTALGRIAYQNKAIVYGLLLKAAAEALTVIAADPKYLGANIGITAVLHSWGENLHHHPHAHCIVPGGGLSPDGKRWVPCKPRFLPPRVLSRLFGRLVLEGLTAAFDAGQLHFFTALSGLNDKTAFAAALAPLRRTDWAVYAKRTFPGPKRVLAYLARYTHRVAISNDRLLTMNAGHVSFSCKDSNGQKRNVTLKASEFIRRFLLHVLPDGFHRIRNYGLLANGHRAEKLALCQLRRIGARMMTMILMRLAKSAPHARAAAGACRSLRASGDRRSALSTCVGLTPCSWAFRECSTAQQAIHVISALVAGAMHGRSTVRCAIFHYDRYKTVPSLSAETRKMDALASSSSPIHPA